MRVATAIRNAFEFNASTGNYAFSGADLSASFAVPAGVGSVTVATGAGDELDASAVPSPGALSLLMFGCLIGAPRRRR